MLHVAILPLGGARRLERPCNVNRFLARAVCSRLRLVEASARREMEREKEIRKEGSTSQVMGKERLARDDKTNPLGYVQACATVNRLKW